MREDEFINSLKEQADGFKVTPSAGLFDKIIVSGNLNNKAAEQDFANMLKEKASGFSVAPSVGLFDKISAASKTSADAEVEQFNHIIKKHAKEFKVTPSNGLFDKIVITRNNLLARRYAIYGIAAILLLSVSSFFYWLSHSTDALKKETETAYISEGAESDRILPKYKTESNRHSKSTKATEGLGSLKKATVVKTSINNTNSQTHFNQNQGSNKSSLFVTQESENVVSGNEGSNPFVVAFEVKSNIDGCNSNTTETSNIETPSTEKSDITVANPDNPKSVEKPIEQKPMEESQAVLIDNITKSEIKEVVPVASVNPPLPAAINQPKKIVGTKWAIGVYGTPQLLKSEYHSNKTKENWANEYLQTKIQNDKSNFNYQAGLLLERKLNNSISLISGIGMSEIKFRELRVVTYQTPSETSGSEYTISNKEYIRKSSYDVTMNYLEIPLHLQYTKHWNRFSMAVQGGIAYNLLIDANAVVFNSDTMNTCIVKGANKTLQQHVFYFSGAVLAEYFPFKKVSVFAGPTYRTALNSVYDDKYVLSQKPYFFGLTMGMKFAF